MVLFEALALFGGLKDVFVYNRDLFMFNRQLNQLRIHQTQKMRIEQVLLFREDVRDLFDLTMGKMKQYLVVNTLTLAFCMGFFYEGRMPFDTPSWLFWLWGMSLATAVLFLLMSVWFAISAVITAQTFAVRLLTQWLRLPVPSRSDISRAAATAADYEKQNASSLLRVPLVSNTNPATSSSTSQPPVPGPISPAGRLRQSASTGDLSSLQHARSTEEQESYPRMINPVLGQMFATEYPNFVEHFHLYRYLQEHWAGYDAYARVCMVVGSAQLVSVIGYMGLAWYVADHSRWGGGVFTVLMMVFGLIHARMNLLLSRKELLMLGAFQIAGPLVGGVATVFYYAESSGLFKTLTLWLAPLAFLFHLLTIVFYLALGSEQTGALPTKYSTVVSIDVLGLWEEDQDHQSEEDSPAPLTGWQKKWLKATKREAPVSVLIPQSADLVNAERERYLRNRNTAGRGGEVFSRHEAAHAAGLTDRRDSTISMLAPTKYSSTLPWYTFRQAGAVTIVLWLIGIGIGVSVAIRGKDIPGWESSPGETAQLGSGTSLWTPFPDISRSSEKGLHRSAYPVTGFLEKVDPELPIKIRQVRAVTKQGLHIIISNQGEGERWLIDPTMKLRSYKDDPEVKDFFSISSLPANVRAPWCSSWEVVTMVDPGVFRDCNDLATKWLIEDRMPSQQFNAVSGRYALNRVNNHIYKFQLHYRTKSLRTEARIPIPALDGGVADLARNEFMLAVLSGEGLVALWSTHHEDVVRRGIRTLPRRTEFVWNSIVGAGGSSVVVLGENRENGLREAFFIHNVFALDRYDRR